MARYAQLRSCDISNGAGIGVSIFFSGCPLRCKGCHNESIWDFKAGKEFTQETIDRVKELIEPDYVTRLSILGGEPFALPNMAGVFDLVMQVFEAKPELRIWIWTGYTWEYLQGCYGPQSNAPESVKQMFNLILMRTSVLVDGPFIQEKKDLSLKWRGSSNQRVIDVPLTLHECFIGQPPIPLPLDD